MTVRAWRAGWQAFWAALPDVFRGGRRRTMLLLVGVGLAIGAALWALLDMALGPGLDGNSIPLAIALCVGGATLAGMLCALLFYRQDRTPEWWIAGTHESTMKRVLASAGSDARLTVSTSDVHDAGRAADVLRRLTPVAIVHPLIGATGGLVVVVTSVAAGAGFASLACLAFFLAQGVALVSSVLTLGRAELVLTALGDGRAAAA